MTLQNSILNAIICGNRSVKTIHAYCCSTRSKRLSLVPIRMLINEMEEQGKITRDGYGFKLDSSCSI